MDGGKVHVQRALTRVGVKGWKLVEPKTSNARRVIPLPAVTVKALREWKALQARERLLLGSEYEDHGSGGFVFATEFGAPLDGANLYSRNFRRIMEAAELGAWETVRVGQRVKKETKRFRPAFRMYDLRHTCATILLGKGINAKIVQERLGHASITLTLDTYSHVLPDMQGEAVEAMDDVFGARVETGSRG
jgi:integrase